MSEKSSMELLNSRVGRRAFLKMGALASIGATGLCAAEESVKTATPAQLREAYPGSKKVRTICTHCSVGCGIVAEVKDGVWVRQEVAYEHPVSLGGHCCKGADLIDKVRSTNRLRYPTVKVDGKWKRTTWNEALDNISKQIKTLQTKYGPDSIMLLGSAKVSNEQSFYIRKFAAFMGTNNIDHQARI
jgi:anaerobic selenocysteine-containing dehydrogenase